MKKYGVILLAFLVLFTCSMPVLAVEPPPDADAGEGQPEEQIDIEAETDPTPEVDNILTQETLEALKEAITQLLADMLGVRADELNLDTLMEDFGARGGLAGYPDNKIQEFAEGVKQIFISIAGLSVVNDLLSRVTLDMATSSNVHHIKTPGDLVKLGKNGAILFGSDWWSDTIILDNDIDMTGVDLPAIGDVKKPFRGTFDGNGHTIYNLGQDNYLTDGMGLFGHTKNAQIKNLTLVNAYYRGKATVGGIVGNMNGGKLINCNVINSNLGTSYHGSPLTFVKNNNVGGLVGYIKDGSIENCSSKNNSITLLSGNGAGGIVGEASNAKITNCVSTNNDINANGVVTTTNGGDDDNYYPVNDYFGGESAGGICGWSSDSTIAYCRASNDVEASMRYAGGLIGSSTSDTIRVCSAGGRVGMGRDSVVSGSHGSITGGNAGGLIGMMQNGSLRDCYATAEVLSYSSDSQINMGGLVGRALQQDGMFSKNSLSVQNCYSTGKVNGGQSTGNARNIGGSVGHNYGAVITSCYYDQERSGMSDTGKGIPKTSADLTDIKTFVGWDISASGSGQSTVWTIQNGGSAPTLTQLSDS